MLKNVALVFCSILIVVLIGMLWLGAYRPTGVRDVKVRVATLDGEEVLVIEGAYHNPWFQSFVIATDWGWNDDGTGTITVVERSLIFNPFGPFNPEHGIAMRADWPLLILKPYIGVRQYTVRYWDGEKNVVLGQLVADEEHMVFTPVDKGVGDSKGKDGS